MNPFKNSKPEQYGSDIQLGQVYRDDQTGVEGVATSVTFFQHACERVCLELMTKDGELKEYVFDAPRLRHVATQKLATSTQTGGPRTTPGQRGSNGR